MPKRTPVKRIALRTLVKRILRSEGIKKGVNIIIGDDESLADLNRRFRAREGPTDVLAFDFDEEDFLGEVYVSLDRVREQSREYGVSEAEEIKRLVIHGVLHLLGYKHNQMPELMELYLK